MNFFKYTSETPMTLLRKKFNNNEDIYQNSPNILSKADALEDIAYAKFVFENAYSGYTYVDKTQFDNGFKKIIKSLNNSITPVGLIDLIQTNLSFITDGHLALTVRGYGKGFYKLLQTFVADIVVKKTENDYFDIKTGNKITPNENVEIFPTLKIGNKKTYLLGVRSKETVKAITVQINGKFTDIPVHRIKSKTGENGTLIDECYDKNTSVITCSSFVGDRQEDFDKFYNAGIKCRNFQHVIWDLSNNTGGNSEFPKNFLTGLYGTFYDSVNKFELQSSLVCAKETGEIKSIPYRLKQKEKYTLSQTEQDIIFKGKLHVIINDRVASSAELALAWAKNYPNITFYGCNSLGVGHFGDLHIYYLPNSKILLWCPQKVFDTDIQETVGLSPDYWIDSSDTVSDLLTALVQE